MISFLRGAFRSLAVSAQVIKANRRLKLSGYSGVLIIGGSVAAVAATTYFSLGKQDEEDIKYKAWERKQMMRILNEVYKIERDGPDLFSKANNGKSVYEILYPNGEEDEDY